MKKYFELFTTFMKIGALAFGGGYAMLPLIQKEIVDNKHWATDEEIVEYYAIGQCTPGLIAINTATFVGCRVAGIPGGIAASVGFVFPAFFIICLIAGLIQNFADLEIVKNAFAGIRVCACILILNTVIRMWKTSVRDAFSAVIFGAVFLLSVFTSLSPVILILAAAAVGLTGGLVLKKQSAENTDKDKKEDLS